MKPLDLTTLIYIISAISLLFAVLMLIYHKTNSTIKGPLYWSLGSFSAVISAVLFATFPLVTGYFAYVISGVFSVLTFCFYWAGISAFKEIKVNFRAIAGLVFLQFVLGTLFYAVLEIPTARMVAFSAVMIITSLFVISDLVKPIAKPYQLAFLLCTIAFVISASTSAFRIVLTILNQQDSAYAPTQANLLVYFFTNLTQALLLFSFVWMIGLKISERLKLKVEAQRKFFSVIAHDLSGPVGTVTQMLELVNNDHDLPDDERNVMLGEVEKLSDSTYHLLQNLLFWSKNQLEDLNPVVKKFDLNEIVLENIKLLRHISAPKDIAIVYEPKPELYCLADERMIDTVVRNLISNAVKFTHSGGRVTITCDKSETNLLVKIADNGIGMSPEVQHNLFKFNGSVTKSGTFGEQGTGLGLYLCKEFVEENNGSLIIRSHENVGTEVVVSLPVV